MVILKIKSDLLTSHKIHRKFPHFRLDLSEGFMILRAPLALGKVR